MDETTNENESEQVPPAVPAQRDFFDDGSFGVELATIDKPEVAKRYTGEQLEARTAVRDAVVRALAEGVGILRIARMLRAQGIAIGEHSIMALRDRRADLVAIEKKQLSQQLGRILKLSADKYETALVADKVPAVQIPVAFGIFADKKAALDGEASLVIEHRHTVDASADAFARKLEEMKRAKAQVNPIDSQSSENPENPEQKG